MAEELILIVEDDEKGQRLARDILRFHGFSTVEAGTGEDGVALAKERKPRAILMDFQLPGIDGIAALRRIREDASTAAIPVVVMTASVMKEDRERFDRAGFDAFITKPLDIDRLPEQIREVIERGRA